MMGHGAVRALMEDEDGRWSTVGALTFQAPEAWEDIDEHAGTMVSTAQARIVQAGVAEDYQHMGIGSELHRIASRELGPGITLAHSGSLTPAGHAFAKSTGGHIPRDAVKGPTLTDRGRGYPSLVASDAWSIAKAGRTRPVEPSPAPAPGPRTRRPKPQYEQLRLDL
jgi:hypothetical protein